MIKTLKKLGLFLGIILIIIIIGISISYGFGFLVVYSISNKIVSIMIIGYIALWELAKWSYKKLANYFWEEDETL